MAGLFDTIKNYYQQNVETPKRMYGESLVKGILGIQSPQTEANFSQEELDVLKQVLDQIYKNKLEYFSRPKEQLLSEAQKYEKLAEKAKQNPDADYGMSLEGMLKQSKILRNAAEGKMPTDFKVDYNDLMKAYPNSDINWRDTLGQFRFKVDDKGNYQVYDTYDFNNPSHKAAVEKYAAMNPISRLYNAIKDFSSNDSSLGEAYLGNTSVPVNINIPNTQVVSPFYKDPFK